MLGLHLTIESGWHVYFPGQNDSGTPAKAKFELPPDFSVGEWQWPVPERHVLPGDLLDHVYHKELTILVPLAVPRSAKPGSTVSIKADVQWLVCQDMCIQEDGQVQLSLPIVASEPAPAASTPAIKSPIAEARKRLPKALPPSGKSSVVSATLGSDALSISAAGASYLAFYPYEGSREVRDLLSTGVSKGSDLKLKLAPADPDRLRIRGIIEVRTSSGASYYNLDMGDNPEGNPPTSPSFSPRPEKDSKSGN